MFKPVSRALLLLLLLAFPVFASAAPALMILDAKSATPLKAGQKLDVTVALRDEKGNPVTIESLKVTHTKKFHLFVLDPTFRDFHHVHPQPTSKPGVYIFSFIPSFNSTYRLWADVTNEEGQQYILGDLNEAHPKFATSSDPVRKSVTGFGLRFDVKVKNLYEGEAAEMQLTVTDQKTGKPFKELQPYLGAFAHAVGIMGDYSSIAHTHPMGGEPGEKDLGGPELDFHITAPRKGIMHLFVQFRVKDKIITAPFILRVSKKKR